MPPFPGGVTSGDNERMKGPGRHVAMAAAVLAKHPPAKIPFRPSFTVAVNGQSQVFPENGPPPRFTVTPAEDLRIDVDVVVPAHHKVTALWLASPESS